MATRAGSFGVALLVLAAPALLGSVGLADSALGASGVPASQARAGFPGKPGKIVFERYLRGSGDSERRAIHVIKPNGRGLQRLTRGSDPNYSADGEQIVFARRGKGGIQSIYRMKANGTKVRRLTRATTLDGDPAWSPDGKWIVFARGRKQYGVWPPRPSDIYKMKANGAKVRRLTKSSDHEDVPDWSPNGKRIAYASSAGIVTMKPNGKGKRVLGGGQPAWSPDGKRIAFNQDGQIWVMAANGRHKRELGPGGDLDGNNPAWSPDGKHIAFVGFYQPGGAGAGTIGIFKMRSNGTHPVQLTVGGEQGDFGLNDSHPAWQPR